MISLGNRSFAGPFLSPLWVAPQQSGLYAVLVPGWRLLTFRALHLGEAADFASRNLRNHPRYAEWLSIAGTEWNLYVATHEMSASSAAERQAAARDTELAYRPQFNGTEQGMGSRC